MWVKVPRANPKLSGKKKKPKQSDGTVIPLQSCRLRHNRVNNRVCAQVLKLCFFLDIREKVLKLKKMGITTVTKDDLDRLSDLEAQEE